jgi:hypothetical protein
VSASQEDQNVTLDHAIEAVRRSDGPLTAAKILEQIPPPSRVPASQLEDLLADACAKGAVFAWPPYHGKAARYWVRRAEDHAESRMMELLASKPLGPSELEKSLTRDLSGHSQAKRRAVIRPLVASLKKQGRLFEYPRLGRAGLKYSRRPAEPGPYLKALKKQFDALATRLRSAGINREQMIAELSNAALPLTSPTAPNLEDSILANLIGKPGGLSMRELRARLQGPDSAKDVFDRAVLSLYQARRVYVDRHDHPSLLSDSEREELVSDGAGNYYTGITLRGDGDQSIS